MRIGLDARWIFPQLSGIGTYTQELARALALLDSDHEFVLFFQDAALLERTWRAANLEGHPRFRAQRVPWGLFSPRGQWGMRRLLAELRLHVFHSPNYMIPLPAFPRRRPHAIRAVVTLHDLIPLLFPHFTPRALKTRLFPVYRALMDEVAKRADLILTVSEASRADIVRTLRVSPERVKAVPNGVSPDFTPGPRAAKPQPTILYVGRFDPYKNVVGLVEAFARLRARLPARLRLVGSPDPRYPEASRRVRELGLGADVEFAGYAEGAQLVEEYRRADVFALLSHYEGFGLTVLEAMACGTPVVASKIPALVEVAGDAALLVEPGDSAAAADALERVLTDEAVRSSLVERGLKRAAAFTWRRTAELTLRAYEEVVR